MSRSLTHALGPRVRDHIAEPANASSGSAQDLARIYDGIEGSNGLLLACERMFEQFARQHGLTPQVAQRLQLEGYRA